MKFCVITLFPEMIVNLAQFGVVGRAIKRNLANLEVINPRDYSTDPNRRVDDRPYGGGPGMVMQFEPLQKAIHKAREHSNNARVVCLSAQGHPIQHEDIQRLERYDPLILLAGRYEGIDERLIETEVDEEITIGNLVVSGGELPAMMMIDAMIRHIPGALGHDESAHQESFVDGLLDCPHYTRPETINGLSVPKVLLGGDHRAIQEWRAKQSLGRTYHRRPDLFEKLELNVEQQALLKEYIQEQQN
jgi:tRNA (guanine37-N1)-methyltransferase